MKMLNENDLTQMSEKNQIEVDRLLWSLENRISEIKQESLAENQTFDFFDQADNDKVIDRGEANE
jgi:hypothetical protein